jgi:hypothetical protein
MRVRKCKEIGKRKVDKIVYNFVGHEKIEFDSAVFKRIEF